MADLSREETSGSALRSPRRPTTCTYGAGLSRARAARCREWADSLPENRLHGVIAGKLYTYASDARVRRWPNGLEITGKGNTSMTNTSVSAGLVSGSELLVVVSEQ